MAPPPLEEYQLSNGLRVAMAPDPTLDDVSVVIRYRVGSADEPEDKDGLAHLVEHLMFGGSRHVEPGGYARWISRVGGSNVNGRTTLDDTLYSVSVPPEALPIVFWLESDRMGFLLDRVTEQTVRVERQIIADEARDALFDRENGFVARVGWMRLFPPWHPYHREFYPRSPANPTLGDVRAFWRTWYSPANATLAMAGRFDSKSVRALVEQYFGPLTANEPPERPDLPERWAIYNEPIEAGARVREDTVAVMWKTPPLGWLDDAALDVAARVLADPGGRLDRRLVARGLATAVTAVESSKRRASVFMITATTAEGTPLDDIVSAIELEVAALPTALAADEFTRAKDEMLDLVLERFESSMSRAANLAFRPPDPAWDLGKYEAIDRAEVRNAVRVNLVPANGVVVRIHRGRQYPPQGIVLRPKGPTKR